MNLPFPVEEKYYHYSRYLHDRFHTRVYRISIDAGFTCPTRDGSIGLTGCLYCSNDSFAPKRKETLPSISDQVKNGMEKIQRFHKAKKFLAYFQPYTNTYAPVDELEKYYREALSLPDIIGLCIGTRPDCVNEDVFRLLETLNRDFYTSVEFGIESVYQKTLEWAKRGHDFEKTKWAIREAKAHGLHVSGHLILGFPTETIEEMLHTADIINELELDAIKIHHLHIVRNTPLANIYEEKPFHVFSEDEWINLVCDFLERLRPDISIQRLCGEAKEGTLIAPLWIKTKSEIIEGIQNELERRNSYQGLLFNNK